MRDQDLDLDPPGRSTQPEPAGQTDTGGQAVDGESGTDQIAFDVGAFPGGARGALEAILMVVDEPIDTLSLASALEMPVEDVSDILASLEEEYVAAHRGFTLRPVGGGWRMYSRTEYAPVVERFVLDGQQARLTQAALETLAVIAYRQPISRSRVGAVRGVNVDGVVRTLLTRGLIEERGSEHESGAILYGTTTTFLERLGLASLEELPALAPYLPEVDVLDEIAAAGRS
jgi:segregation and condensation protein B